MKIAGNFSDTFRESKGEEKRERERQESRYRDIDREESFSIVHDALSARYCRVALH